jgi:phasin
MAKDPATAAFEVPKDMRAFAEQSVEQARKAFDGFFGAVQKAANTMEGHAAAAQAGAKDVRDRAMTLAETNVARSFDYAQRLMQARTPDEVMRLQAEFVQQQMQAMSEQTREFGEKTRELGEKAARTAMDAARPKS